MAASSSCPSPLPAELKEGTSHSNSSNQQQVSRLKPLTAVVAEGECLICTYLGGWYLVTVYLLDIPFDKSIRS